jgi:hypothetical protein
MHSIIRNGQVHGQLHGQFRRQTTPPPAIPNGPLLERPEWQQRSLVRTVPTSGRIDVCRLIVATFGLGLYLALPVAAIGLALNLIFY